MRKVRRVGRRGFSGFIKKLRRGIRNTLQAVTRAWRRFTAWLRNGKLAKFLGGLSLKTKIIGGSVAAGVLAVVIVLTIVLTPFAGEKEAGAINGDVTSIAAATAKPIDDMESLTQEQKDSVISDVVQERENDPPQDVYKYGDDHTEVMVIQQRLMELGYMGEDEPSYYYGPTTTQAVTNFQKKCGMTEDGIIGKETYAKLFAEDAPYYTVSEGAEGSDVKDLQERLVDLGFLEKATGYFGTSTTAAVKSLQQKNGLAADGSIGKMTRELLYSDNIKANVLGPGDKGDMVKKYQQKLMDLAYLTTKVDGTYGQDTVDAVKQFQEDYGLVADGYLGASTREALDSEDVIANVLKLGDEGAIVTKIQKHLKNYGYLSSGATGYFGEDTEKAVKQFQQKNGLSADGKVGASTLRVMASGNAINVNGSRGSTSSGVNRFINIAMSKLGCKYVLGAKGPNRFDCSGFVYWCLNQAGISQGYMTSYYWQRTTRYKRISSMSELRRGDVISYKGHVAICAGNGYMIDASSRNGKVVYRSYQSSYWYRNFVCGYRIF